MGNLAEFLLILAALASILVVGYVFLVVRALHRELIERGVAAELIPRPKKEHASGSPAKRAQKFIDGLSGR